MFLSSNAFHRNRHINIYCVRINVKNLNVHRLLFCLSLSTIHWSDDCCNSKLCSLLGSCICDFSLFFICCKANFFNTIIVIRTVLLWVYVVWKHSLKTAIEISFKKLTSVKKLKNGSCEYFSLIDYFFDSFFTLYCC